MKIALGLAMLAALITCCALQTNAKMDLFDFMALVLAVGLVLLIVCD